MSFRRFPAEYVSKHLHGLAVHSVLPAEASTTLIATHSGSFHCDEALACSLLGHTAIGKEATIVRTRDPQVIDACGVVVDVGAVYDPSRHRYDHHQQTFHDCMQFTLNSYSPAKVKQYQTRLSSAGLVYKHFGREVIATFVRDAVQHSEVLQTLLQWPNDKKELSERELDVLYTKMYEAFVEEVDGVDNGVECFSAVLSPAPTEPETSPVKAVLHRNYQQSTSLSSRVGQLQTWWNEPQETENKETKENMNFAEAMEMAGIAFFEKLFFYAFSWLPARGLVEDAFNARFTIDGGDSEGRIVVFHNSFCPWKDHLFTIEEEHAAENKSPILYVLYSDGKGWRVQAVPKEVSSFESRKALPFKGLRDEELSAASGIEGGVFVHVSGFIGGMKTLEGALALAKKAIEA